MGPSLLRRVAIFTRSLEKSLQFWGEGGLGMRALVTSHDDALLESNGVGIHLRQTHDEALLSVGYGPMLQVDVQDVGELVPRLLAVGATMDGVIVYHAEATLASLRSPCGVVVTLVELLSEAPPGASTRPVTSMQ